MGTSFRSFGEDLQDLARINHFFTFSLTATKEWVLILLYGD